MTSGTLLLIATVFIALVFDFFNGFHDAANSIATVVSTRVLTPRVAVAWAAVFNFLAAFFLGTAVAKTIGKGMIDLSIVTQYVVLAGLLGCLMTSVQYWNWYGFPTNYTLAQMLTWVVGFGVAGITVSLVLGKAAARAAAA